jgi:hypothetical protein
MVKNISAIRLRKSFLGSLKQPDLESAILIDMTSNASSPTHVRLRIVWISVLMAFGLYLTRNTIGEIVKSDSFLKDTSLVGADSTRFSVELKDGLENSQVQSWLTSKQSSDAKALDFSKIKTPYTVASKRIDCLGNLSPTEEPVFGGYPNPKSEISWEPSSSLTRSFKFLRVGSAIA